MQSLLAQIFKDLYKGASIPKHPYRYFCLSSIENDKPKQRMVVFRKITNNTISIFTDIRTPKVKQYSKNKNASVLLYDYKKMTQVELNGVIEIESEYDQKVWNSISPKAKKDYTTSLAPGSSISNPEAILYGEKINFCILKFTFNTIDFLNINRPFHTRAKFNLIDNNWQGTYVIP